MGMVLLSLSNGRHLLVCEESKKAHRGREATRLQSGRRAGAGATHQQDEHEFLRKCLTRVPNTSHHDRRTRGATAQQRRHPTTRSSAPRHRGQKRQPHATSGQPNARLQQTRERHATTACGTKRHHRRTAPIPCHLHHEC